MIGELDYCKRANGIAYVRDRRPGLEMIITGASITHGGNRAFYRPSTDTIRMPPSEAFRDAEIYYGRLADETTPLDHASLARWKKAEPLEKERAAA